MQFERFSEIRFLASGGFSWVDFQEAPSQKYSAQFPLFLIREAWGAGVEFEDIADGFGKGQGTRGEWSGIRDSSEAALVEMFQRALNHFFGKG